MDDVTVIRPRWHRRWLLHLALLQSGATAGLLAYALAEGAPLDARVALTSFALLVALVLLRVSRRQHVVADAEGLHRRGLAGVTTLAEWEQVADIAGGRGTIPVAVLHDGEQVPLLDIGQDGVLVAARLRSAWTAYAA